MRVLLACEESQIVCKAFRERGHEAFSCDIKPSSGGFPEWHIIGNALQEAYSGKYDLMIGFPPCTFLSSVQLFRMKDNPSRQAEKENAKKFFLALWNAPIKKICLENPVGCISTELGLKQSQIIHPYYFGDQEMKRTCLWLKGLSRLNGLKHVNHVRDKPKPRRSFVNRKGQLKNVYFSNDTKDIHDSEARSKFWPGIANAMADQWGGKTALFL
jgi:hypothetical protein